jgi:hypothetical protein
MCFPDRSSREQWVIATSLSGRNTFQVKPRALIGRCKLLRQTHGRYVMCAITTFLEQEREGRTAVLGG